MVARNPSSITPRESSKSSEKASSGAASKSRKDDNDGVAEEMEHDYQTYAQKLNNNAAVCIEIGYYDKATQSLQRALNFYQKQSDESMMKMCPCDKCEIDGNIDFSADFRAKVPRGLSITSMRSNDSDDDDEYISKPRRNFSKEDIKWMSKSISNPRLKKSLTEEVKILRGEGETEKNAQWSIKDEFCEDELEIQEDEEEAIYKRPIRVERVGCPMGGSLFLIITFNLALTHHLEVVMARSKKRFEVKSAKKALLFYELTSTHEIRLLSDSGNRWDSLSSIRFNKILDSNLNQLIEHLPESSLPAVQRVVSAVCYAITTETERLSPGSSSRSSRCSRSPSRWSNYDTDSSRTLQRSFRREYSDSSGESLMSRSSKKSPKNYSGKTQRRGSMGGGSVNSIRLQNALGDMAPTSSSRTSRRNSIV